MEKLIEIFIKFLVNDPIYIFKNFSKFLRILNLLLFSAWIYKVEYGNFLIIENVQELLDFFTSGLFIKPVIIFFLSIIIFDALFGTIIKGIFRKILGFKKFEAQFEGVAREFKTAAKLGQLQSIEIEITNLATDKLKHFNKYIFKFFSKNIILEDVSEDILKININGFDRISLIIGQFLTISFIYWPQKVTLIIVLTAGFLILQYFKKVFAVSQAFFLLMEMIHRESKG